MLNKTVIMKVLIVSQSFYPDTFAINDIVQKLVRNGHSVTVLTGLPDYTTSRIPEEYRFGKNRKQSINGASVFRVPTVARRHGPIWRSLNYVSFALNGSIFAITHKWDNIDVIYVWQVSPVTMAIPAIVLKRKLKKPLFLYCLDIWPECVKAMGFKENTVLYNIIKKISRWIYNKCDHIAVSSKPFFGYLEQVNDVDKNKISYLPQYAISDLVNRDYRKDKADNYDFVYIGNIGKAQDMDCLIKAISLLNNKKKATFHIIGGGSEYENTVRLAEEHNIENIHFYGPKPFEEASEFYKIADACILTLDGSNHIGDTLPGKLQTYMAAGKPIIGAMNGAGKEVIEESGCGLCAAAGDYRGFADLLDRYIDHYEDFSDCGDNGRKYYLTHFTAEIHFKELEKELSDLIYHECTDN